MNSNKIRLRKIIWDTSGSGPSFDNNRRGVIILDSEGAKYDNPASVGLYYKALSKSRYVTVFAYNACEQISGIIKLLESLHESGYHTALVLDMVPEELLFMGERTEKLLKNTDILVMRRDRGFRPIQRVGDSLFMENVSANSIIVDVAAGRSSERYEGHLVCDVEYLALKEDDELVFVLSEYADPTPYAIDLLKEEERREAL